MLLPARSVQVDGGRGEALFERSSPGREHGRPVGGEDVLDVLLGQRAKGGLRFWNQGSSTGAAWYRDVFAATLRPLAEQDIEYVLTTHGPAVLANGRRALEECLAAPPVDLY